MLCGDWLPALGSELRLLMPSRSSVILRRQSMHALRKLTRTGLGLAALVFGLLWPASIWFPYNWRIGSHRPGEPFTAVEIRHEHGRLGVSWYRDAYHVPLSQATPTLGRVYWRQDYCFGAHVHKEYLPLYSPHVGQNGRTCYNMVRYLVTCPAWILFIVFVPYPAVCIGRDRIYCSLRRRHRRTRNKCIECGYDLSGAVSDTCSECGAAISTQLRQS